MNERIKMLLAQMTPEEKAAQLQGTEARFLVDGDKKFSPEKAEKLIKHGIGHIAGVSYGLDLMPEQIAALTNEIQCWLAANTRMKLPAIFHEECLAGLVSKGVPIFPQAIGLGAMWEPGLVHEMAASIRGLIRSMGGHQALSPVLDMAHDPRWGRNEESYGEDACLVAENACAFITGLQGDLKTGVAATTKHFAGHAMSEGGRNCSPVRIGMRELRDTVLLPFEAAIRQARAVSVMNAYHDIDGVPCAASHELLTGILRDEWGFKGAVVSDYGSVERLISQHFTAGDKMSAAKQALEAGLDVELPTGDCYGEPLLQAVRDGLVSGETVDTAAGRVLYTKLVLGMLDGLPASGDPRPHYTGGEPVALARKLASKSIVLLKNECGILPLVRENLKAIAVIGPSAHSRRNFLGSYSYLSLSANRFKGQDNEDSVQQRAGRSIATLLECIREKAGSAEVRHAEGCGLFDDSPEDIASAVGAARGADVAIMAVGERSAMFEGGTTGENIDRTCVTLSGGQERLVRAVAETGTPVVLVVVSGRPLVLTEPVGLAQAAMMAWVPGEQGAGAIADVLFGDSSPAGRLPVTLLKHQGQHPMPYNMKKINYHKAYLDSDMKPLFPFGHGLGYTAFEYSNLTVTPETLASAGEITVSLSVRNCGGRAGEEVVQLYIHDVVASLAKPARELKGFKRIELDQGETRRVEFTLHTDQLAFHNRDMELAVEPGRFEVLVGSSSGDIRLTGEFTVEGLGFAVDKANRVYFCRVVVK